MELLAAQYPANNECDVFDQSKNDNVEHPQKLAGEKCSINEEVELMMDMRTCSTNAQVRSEESRNKRRGFFGRRQIVRNCTFIKN